MSDSTKNIESKVALSKSSTITIKYEGNAKNMDWSNALVDDILVIHSAYPDKKFDVDGLWYTRPELTSFVVAKSFKHGEKLPISRVIYQEERANQTSDIKRQLIIQTEMDVTAQWSTIICDLSLESDGRLPMTLAESRPGTLRKHISKLFPLIDFDRLVEDSTYRSEAIVEFKHLLFPQVKATKEN